jgi:hypothetical protein
MSICYQKSINVKSRKQLIPNGFAPLLGRGGRGRGRYFYGVRRQCKSEKKFRKAGIQRRK